MQTVFSDSETSKSPRALYRLIPGYLVETSSVDSTAAPPAPVALMTTPSTSPARTWIAPLKSFISSRFGPPGSLNWTVCSCAVSGANNATIPRKISKRINLRCMTVPFQILSILILEFPQLIQTFTGSLADHGVDGSVAGEVLEGRFCIRFSKVHVEIDQGYLDKR